MVGAAILATEGIKELTDLQLQIDIQVDDVWETNVATAGIGDVSRSGNSIIIDENVDYTNNTAGTKVAQRARVRAFLDGIVSVSVLFPDKAIGNQSLLEGQILRFTNISCNLNS